MIEAAAAAWSASIGAQVRLTDVTDLGGSTRSAVLRVAVEGPSGCPSTAIIKSFPLVDGAPPPEFADEVAAAAFAPSGPRLLAHDPVAGVAVLTDLGRHRSLADLLLGSAPDPARVGVVAWADALGSLAAWSVGRRSDYDATRASLGLPPTADRLAERLATSVRIGLANLCELACTVPGGRAQAEVDDAVRVLGVGPLTVFSPADACPDNNLVTPDGLRLLDYESAGFHSAFLDVVYCRMPFPSCWCAFQLPADLAAEAERTYRALLAAAVPEAADDHTWELGLLRAEAVWVLSQASWLLPQAQDDNETMGGSLGGPRRRTLLVHRWRRLAGSLAAQERFPQLVAVLEAAAEAAQQQWGPVPPLTGYPAFAR